jgi:ATP-dependent Clp protease ATP-binding subunit ClpX
MSGDVIMPQSIFEYLDKYVVGQTEAKRVLAQVGFMHLSKMWHYVANADQIDRPIRASHALIMGPTGCGKTYLIQRLAEVLRLPLLEVNARAMTQEGYKGMNMSEYFKAFRDQYSAERIYHGIVFIDEFDKICGTDGGDRWESAIQYTMLKVIEGSGIYIPDGPGSKDFVPTSGMLFIFGGNFSHVIKTIENPKLEIGFGHSRPSKPKHLHESLTKAGVILEIMGRISLITRVHKLTKSQLRQALIEGPLKQYQEIYEDCYNSSLDLSPYHINKIVEMAEAKDIGVRGLQAALDEYLQNHLYEHGELDPEFLKSYNV